MDNQKLQLIFYQVTTGGSLGLGALVRDEHVAQVNQVRFRVGLAGWKRQDIGRGVDPQVLPVELAQLDIVSQDKRQICAAWCTGMIQGLMGRAVQERLIHRGRAIGCQDRFGNLETGHHYLVLVEGVSTEVLSGISESGLDTVTELAGTVISRPVAASIVGYWRRGW